jgi:hypothetical protein
METSLKRGAARYPKVSWTLIYLNAAFVSWQTVSVRVPDASSLGQTAIQLMAAVLTRAAGR